MADRVKTTTAVPLRIRYRERGEVVPTTATRMVVAGTKRPLLQCKPSAITSIDLVEGGVRPVTIDAALVAAVRPTTTLSQTI